MRVKITARKHPHYGATGVLEDDMLPTGQFIVHLDWQYHRGIERCGVSKGQFKPISDKGDEI